MAQNQRNNVMLNQKSLPNIQSLLEIKFKFNYSEQPWIKEKNMETLKV